MDRNVSLFRNGRSQAVRIPREFELPGTKAVMRKEGHRLVIEPVVTPFLLNALKGLPPLSADDRLDAIAALPLDPVEM